MSKFQNKYHEFLSALPKSQRRSLTSIEGADAYGTIMVNGKRYIDFSSNDYLGLRFNPQLIQASNYYTQKWGAGSSASRLITGNLEIFDQLEEILAEFKGFQTSLLLSSGYLTNTQVLKNLLQRDVLGETPYVFADKLIHNSLISGILASNAKLIRYRHNDIEHLKTLLKKHSLDSNPKFIVTESVFSMDGDFAPIKELVELKNQFGVFLYVDEAHATGVFGEGGRGLCYKYRSSIDCVMSTLSKALGASGGFIACSKIIKDYLINTCPGVIYTTAPQPSLIGAGLAALRVVEDMDIERQNIRILSHELREGLTALGYSYGTSQTQIIPIILGSNEQTNALSDSLKEAGLWLYGIRPPTVPHNQSRLRVSLSAMHTSDQIHKLLSVLKYCQFQKHQKAVA